MFAISYIFAYILNIVMLMRHPIVPVRGPPDPVQFFFSSSDDTTEPFSYIFCLHGQVPVRYEIWRLNDCGVHKVHMCAQVRLFNNFREDTFKIFSLIRGDGVFLSLVEYR